jgi:hypothetical protein
VSKKADFAPGLYCGNNFVESEKPAGAAGCRRRMPRIAVLAALGAVALAVVS